MNWFSGEIQEAIEKSIKEKKLFIVFVKDNGENSHLLNAMWNDEQILSLFNDGQSINIMISVDSVTGKQFAAIYSVPYVPSTYLINNEGIPIDIIPGVLPVNEFKQRLLNALKTQESKRLESVVSSEKRLESEVQSENNLRKSEDKIETSPLAADTEEAQKSVQEKQLAKEMTNKEKAEALLERSRIIKQQKEKEKLKEQEKNRVREGQELSLAKRELAERQAALLAAEISKRKAEEKAAREKLREQLRLDKIEKNARFEMEKKSRNEALTEKKQAVASPVLKAESNSTRIQFRLPDGSSLSNQFPADAMFLSLHDFICKHMRESNLRLTTLFPKYEFTTSDMEKSLRELSLVPNASIIVSPGKPQVVSTPQSLPISIIIFIFYPLISLYYWVLSFFSTTTSQQPSIVSQNDEGDKLDTSHYNSNKNIRKRNNQSNIRQLQRDENDDDENNTWNGNSTQQM
uniref:UBX domain-containing protein 4 n=1 Tax=Hydra vulgaris TaxID=6087 RepID=T2M8H8_HYDVU